jgi:hypothetical protein
MGKWGVFLKEGLQAFNWYPDNSPNVWLDMEIQVPNEAKGLFLTSLAEQTKYQGNIEEAEYGT